MSNVASMAVPRAQTGFLGWIERTGNRLPDPVFLFLYLILGLVVISVVAQWMGVSALHPTIKDPATGTGKMITVASLLSAANIQKLWVEMPRTFTGFHPLGMVMVVMLGAGVAERTGLFGSAMRASVANAPKWLLTPIVAFVAMMGHLAADAAYVVLIPLAALIYHAAGRHPIAGIAASFAAVSGGFSANLFPGQLDALLFGITQSAVVTILPGWKANIAGNWYFIMGMTFVFLPVIWYVTDKMIEPRLGKFRADQMDESHAAEDKDLRAPLTDAQKRGLRHAGYAALAVIGLWVFMTWGPGTPLIDVKAPPAGQMTPFYQSLVAGFMMLFLASGWAYGKAAGTLNNHRDLVKMMTKSMGDMAYFLVLAVVVSHFVAIFNWSNLGLIIAVHGADALRSMNMPAPMLLTVIVLFTAFVNLFIGSASAKWALLAPVMVPMLMLVGVSAEMTTAAYRVGDGATNIITPLMVYFPLILVFCQRWNKEFGMGSLAAMMLPYSMGILFSGILQVIVWVALEIPLGPATPVFIPIPGAS